MQTGVICPLFALLTRSALSAYTAHFAQPESHTQTGFICPSLTLLAHSVGIHCSDRITHADRRDLPITHVARSFSDLGIHCSRRITDRRQLPIARVARSFRALRRHCSLRSRRISAHGIALFALQERHLVGDQVTTWWHGSHDLPHPDCPPKYQPNQTTSS